MVGMVACAKSILPKSCNALYGRELEVLAAVVLGGPDWGWPRHGLRLHFGVMFVAVTQNGLNLLGIAVCFQMIIGGAILIAISAKFLFMGPKYAKRPIPHDQPFNLPSVYLKDQRYLGNETLALRFPDFGLCFFFGNTAIFNRAQS